MPRSIEARMAALEAKLGPGETVEEALAIAESETDPVWARLALARARLMLVNGAVRGSLLPVLTLVKRGDDG